MDETEYLVGAEFAPRVIELINEAKNKIDIAVFDWRWYPSSPGGSVGLFNTAIVSASLRGVAVRAVVNNDEIAKRLSDAGILVHRVTTARLVHVKMILIDDRVVVIGSHNYTSQAFSVNMEASVVIQNQKPGNRLSTFFENLWLL